MFACVVCYVYNNKRCLNVFFVILVVFSFFNRRKAHYRKVNNDTVVSVNLPIVIGIQGPVCLYFKIVLYGSW